MVNYINEVIIDSLDIVHRKISVTYTVLLRNVSGRQFFALYITLHNFIKMSNYPYIFEIEDLVIDKLRNVYKELSTVYQPSIIAVFEFEQRVNFLPDLRILNNSQDIKKNLETKHNVSLDGAIALFKYNNKVTTFNQAFDILLRGTNIHVVASLEESYKIWNDVIKNSKTKQVPRSKVSKKVH